MQLSGKTKFLIVGTGRSGSTLLAAIIAKSGGNFGLPSLDQWDRRRGALEHPHVHAAYRWYSRATRVRESLIPNQVATVCLKLCRAYLEKSLGVADYLKSSQLVWLVDEANRLSESIGVVGIYRKFSGYLLSRYRKFGGNYNKWRDTWTNVNGTILLQAHTYPFALVSYEELVDPTESEWAERLHQLIPISAEKMLSSRKELMRPTGERAIETFEDEETTRLYQVLRNYQGIPD